MSAETPAVRPSLSAAEVKELIVSALDAELGDRGTLGLVLTLIDTEGNMLVVPRGFLRVEGLLTMLAEAARLIDDEHKPANDGVPT
jgi:hypothetical protein